VLVTRSQSFRSAVHVDEPETSTHLEGVMLRVSSSRDLWTGLIYLAIGAAGLWFGLAYPMGTAGRMGSGYFPKVLAALLVSFGVFGVMRSVTIASPAITPVSWRPLILVLVACMLFTLLLEPTGFIVATAVFVLTRAAASQQFKLDILSLLGLAVLVTVCALVFVVGLGIPMPLVGPWLEPFVSLLPFKR
jgi:Tripartite tricarboxylate transporter TctB family